MTDRENPKRISMVSHVVSMQFNKAVTFMRRQQVYRKFQLAFPCKLCMLLTICSCLIWGDTVFGIGEYKNNH